MNRIVLPSFAVALALGASANVLAQRAVVSLAPETVAADLPTSAPGVSTLSIDTRNTGVDFGLSRRGETAATRASATRKTAPGNAMPATDASATATRSLEPDVIDRGEAAPILPIGQAATNGSGSPGAPTREVDRGVSRTTAPARPTRSTDAATAADAAARSRNENHTAVSGRIGTAQR